MLEYQSHILKNGIRIVHKPSLGPVSYGGYIINAGTRDEQTDEYGMAHLVEHLLFKGTTKRRPYHIINRMENVGGELNAYTNKEETVIYSIFLEEYFDRAFELLTDLTFNSQFPQHEIEKEIDVIIDEIHSYEDSPSELIFDEFENLIFANSQLEHNILGEPSLLQTFDTQKARLFTKKHYIPSNIVFFSVGKTNFKKIIRLAENSLQKIEEANYDWKRIVPSVVKPKQVEILKDTSQAHVMIGSIAYHLHDKKRRPLMLLNNILGGPGMNSRLNISLREKHGYVYNVESSVNHYTDTGLFAIYFGSDKQNAEKCVKLIHKELKKMRDKQLSSTQLHAAKKQLVGQMAIANDQSENVALALGKSFLHYGHINSLDEIFKQIEALTSSQLLDVANEIFDEKALSSLIYI